MRYNIIEEVDILQFCERISITGAKNDGGKRSQSSKNGKSTFDCSYVLECNRFILFVVA